jgi:hypothetical protein
MASPKTFLGLFWAAKFPWADVIMGEDGKMHHVWCKICINVEWREKLLVP